MYDINLADKNWEKIYAFLQKQEGIYVKDETACRQFVEAVLWILQNEAQWRSLPKDYGLWNSVYKRFVRWGNKGIWTALHAQFADDPEMESMIKEGTIARAHDDAENATQAPNYHYPEQSTESSSSNYQS